MPRPEPQERSHVVLRIAIVVFLAEGAIMLLLSGAAPSQSDWGHALVDAVVLTLLTAPIIHFWVIRPYVRQRNLAEKALRGSEERLNGQLLDLESARVQLEVQGADLVALAEGLNLARDQADDANRGKSEFLAHMSHELRTPLNAILGFSDVVAKEMLGPIGNGKYREYVQDINQAGHHLLDLINDILDLSKIESGVDALEPEEIDIPALALSAMTLVKGRAHKGGVALESDVAADVPALVADKRRVKQILVNLLSNAVKFTPAGGKVTLECRCDPASGHVFRITDTGVGIALHDIPKALAPFQQVDSALDRKSEGTGLGLPLTKSLVERHGGSLDLQSRVDVGTTVTVRFPAERIAPAPADAPCLEATQ